MDYTPVIKEFLDEYQINTNSVLDTIQQVYDTMNNNDPKKLILDIILYKKCAGINRNDTINYVIQEYSYKKITDMQMMILFRKYSNTYNQIQICITELTYYEFKKIAKFVYWFNRTYNYNKLLNEEYVIECKKYHQYTPTEHDIYIFEQECNLINSHNEDFTLDVIVDCVSKSNIKDIYTVIELISIALYDIANKTVIDDYKKFIIGYNLDRFKYLFPNWYTTLIRKNKCNLKKIFKK